MLNPQTQTQPAMLSGYQFEGKEIVVGRPSGRPKVYRNKDFYDQTTKVDAATLYCVYGDFEEVAKLTNVPITHLRAWKEEPWWIEIQKRVFIEQNDRLGSRINIVLDTAINQIADRLENGDTTYNPKTGKITRKPVEAKVLSSLFESLSHQRRLVRNEPTTLSAKVGVDENLKKLEEAFRRFANAKEIDASSIETPASGLEE